jgi:hypothetical protein
MNLASGQEGSSDAAREEATAELPLSQGWTVCIDARWEERLGCYGWRVDFKGQGVHALRQIKSSRSKKTFCWPG